MSSKTDADCIGHFGYFRTVVIRSIKNMINLRHYYLPGELEREIERFVDRYNNHRYHESLDNLTPADVYFGRKRERLTGREIIKRETMKLRRAWKHGERRFEKTVAPY